MNVDRFPSLTALRVFAACTRTRSFARAAEEFGISPGAVTQHVRTVEKWVNAPLFRRTGRSVVPTEAAEAALPVLLEGFHRLAEGADTLLSFGSAAQIISVHAPPAFASKWLLPRLPAFLARHPEIDIWVQIDPNHQSPDRRAPDIVISYGLEVGDGYVGEPLIRDSVVVVASPEFVRRYGPFDTPEKIASAPLLHYDSRHTDQTFPTWQRWFRAQGLDLPDLTKGSRFDHPGLLVEYAIAGQGIALAKRMVAITDIDAGRLEILSTFGVPVASSYWLSHMRGRTMRAASSTFWEWVKEEVRSVRDSTRALAV